MNAAAVERILNTVSMCVQLGGGIRDMATVEGWLSKGVNRVIIGTAAVRDPAFVKEAAREFPKQVAVGLDAKDGKVAVQGWAETSELTVLDIARRFEDAGVAAIIYTDVARDGMLTGLNLDATIALAEAVSISGGCVGWSCFAGRYPPAARTPRQEAVRRDCRPRTIRRAARSGAGARHGPGGTRSGLSMFKVRVIPCLDVKDGRVVKGVNFVDLRDAGDPVEAAIAYDAAGADELCFLDITASHENRDTIFDVVTERRKRASCRSRLAAACARSMISASC